MQIETVSGYQFHPDDLAIGERKSGISAFLRTRNGADFLAATIRSHMPFYDEIVAVYNQCEDDTPAILAGLAQEFTPRLRVFHYTDRVQPLGSAAHARTPGNSPQSMVNYSNFALSRTRHRIVVKLDDDHLAIPERVAPLCHTLRNEGLGAGLFRCFSGLNLARATSGELGIPAHEMLSGGGDIGYFEVAPDTFFYHDRRFERFARGRLRRVFAGFLYWHLKFLKTGGGFVNYELGANPDSRFARKRNAFVRTRLLELPEARRALRPNALAAIGARLGAGKARLNYARNQALGAAFPDPTLVAALDRLSPGWRDIPGLLHPLARQDSG